MIQLMEQAHLPIGGLVLKTLYQYIRRKHLG